MAKADLLETKISFISLKAVLYALLLTPLWVWSIFLFPFITTKILYFRLLVEIALVLYIILAIQHPQIRPRWNWLTRAVWIYVGVILLTGIFGVDFSASFFGSIERGEGIITILHFAIYFTILTGIFRTREEWYKYLFFAVNVTVAVGLYGLAQLFNFPYVIHAGATRISGTIGNASFFAAFMLFGAMLALYLQNEAVTSAQKWYLRSIFAFEFIILFLTQTRGAVIAAATAFLIYFAFNIFKSRDARVKIVSSSLLFLLIAGGVLIYANRTSEWVRKNHTVYRLATISASDITTQSRLDTWKASWEGAKERIVSGYGYENYNIAFNKYFPARIFKDQGSQIWFDRAHNIFFDVLVTSGAIGLLTYAGMFIAAFWILRRLFRKKSAEYSWRQPLVLAALLMAYVIQNLFVFDTQATYLMIFLVFGLIVSLEKRHLAAVSEKPVVSYPPGFFLPFALAALFFATAYFINIEPAFANIAATDGIKAAKLKQYRDVKKLFEKSLSYGTYMDIEIRQRLVDYSNEAMGSGELTPEEQKQLQDFVLAELRKSLKESPRDVKNYLYVMNVLNRTASNSGVIQEIYRLGDKAMELSPTRPQIYTELGQAAFNEKNTDKGLEYFRKAVELNPEPKESHFNYLLAAIIAKREDIKTSEMAILRDQLKYVFTTSDYLAFVRAYVQAGDKQKAIEALRQAVVLSPENTEIYIRLAALYGEMCDLENAKKTIDKLVEIDQSFALQGKQFIDERETKCESS